MVLERRPVKLSELTLDLLLDFLVETIERLDELVKIEELHYFRDRELLAKYASWRTGLPLGWLSIRWALVPK